jgi:hypothetical protein
MLRATGQLCAVSSIHLVSSSLYLFTKLNWQCISEILLGLFCITLTSSHVVLSMLIFLFLPIIAIVVKAHWASETAHRSVGENFYPLPWLSVGASLYIWVPLCKCMASHLKPPTYFIVEVISKDLGVEFTFGIREPVF